MRPSSRGRLITNERVTASAAVVLIVLLAVEGVTLLQIRSLVRPHVFVGVLLIPPVLVKIGSTFYRFTRYYLGDPTYRAKGPPPWLLRVMGPGVVALTLVLLGSGVALLLVGPPWTGTLFQIHRVSFFLWFVLMTLHVLGHLRDTARLGLPDWAPPGTIAAAPPSRRGAAGRRRLLLLSVAIGVIPGVWLTSRVSDFLSWLAVHQLFR